MSLSEKYSSKTLILPPQITSSPVKLLSIILDSAFFICSTDSLIISFSTGPPPIVPIMLLSGKTIIEVSTPLGAEPFLSIIVAKIALLCLFITLSNFSQLNSI